MPSTRAELCAHLAELARALGEPSLPNEMADRLAEYVELVEHWNRRVDLTGAKTARDLVEVLLADALVMRDVALVPGGASVLDVGTGVGAPIIPFLILRPDASAQCYEPRRKRVAFLRTAIGQLGLVSRITIKEERIELDGAALVGLGQPSIACSRATFGPCAWLELGLKLAPAALVFGAREALPEPPSGARRVAERSYVLPWSRAPRVLGAYARD